MRANITAYVTLTGYENFQVTNAGKTPGTLVILRSDIPNAGNSNGGGVAWQTISSNVTNIAVDCGSTGGYFTCVFNNNNASQATYCETSPISFSVSTGNISNGGSFSVTITCTLPDLIPPVFQSAATNTAGTLVNLTYNEDMECSYADNSDFTVNVNGTPITVSNIIYDNTIVGLSVTPSIQAGQTVTVSLNNANEGIVDCGYNASANLTNQAVANNVVSPGPTVTTQASSAITATSAIGNGTITATNGANATIRGAIIYPYTNTDKVIGDAGVINIPENGDFGTGAFTASLTPLSVNTQYNVRAYATSPNGTGYSSRGDFWTLANAPLDLTIDGIASTSLNIGINGNSNPASTECAIQETSGLGKYVQVGGTLGADGGAAVWQSETAWENASGNTRRSVTGLTPNTSYTFRNKARNGASTETAFSGNTTIRTLAAIPSAPTVNGATTTSLNVAINANGNPAGTEFAIQEIGGNYVQLDDGALEATPDWHNAADWGTITVTGLSLNTQYTFQVKARNGEATPVETVFGASASLYTLANIPSAPTVNNATATTLDVSINVNSNPSGTEFAIQETGTGNYVQADGSNLAGGIVWHTAAIWDSPITVTGLTTGNTYTFQVQARNGNNVETAFGATTSGIPVAAPTVTTQASSAITATSATGNGTITATNGANATVRGAIIYPYTNTDLEIGGLNVINVAENGDFGTGAFTASLSSLSVNTQYNVRAYATSPNGTGYGTRVSFWTLANVPSAPTVTNPSTGTSLNVAINANGNPAATEFAIRTAGKYVQANGSLGVGAVWQTALTWGTIEVTSLTTGVEYTFDVKARNGNNVETGFSATTSGTPVAHPTTQASGIEFSSITRNSITVRWINGNGDKRILLGRERYSIPSNPLTDGESYAANSNYTSATTVSGAKVLYNNTGTSVTVSGLTRYSLVYFKVMEYNEPTPGNTLYLQTDAAGNPRSRWTLRRDGIMAEDLTIDAEYAYPNPASYSISTTLDMFEAGTVSAKLYDAAGRVAAELYNQSLPFGTHELKFDISNVPSGVYQLIISKGSEAIVYPVSVVR